MSEPAADYGLKTRRLCSVAVKVTTVKKEPAVRITVKWEEATAEGWDKHHYSSTREAHQSFWNRRTALAPYVSPLLGMAPIDGLSVVEVKQTYDDEDNMIATIKADRSCSGGVGSFETPAVAQSGDYLVHQTPDYTAALEAFGREALLYATGMGWDLFNQQAPEQAEPATA